MGSRGTSSSSNTGITLADGQKIASSEMNSLDTWRKIGDFAFADYRMLNDGEIVMSGALRKDVSKPVSPRLYKQVSPSFESSFVTRGPFDEVDIDASAKAIAANVKSNSKVDYYLRNTDRIVIESNALNRELASELTKYGFTQVGVVAPPRYMPYNLWEKKNK